MNKQLNLFELSSFILKDNQPLLPDAKLERKIKRPCRDQIEFTIESLDQSIPLDHQVRTIWNFIELLDFRKVYKRYSSLKDDVGRPITDVKILVALWIYAICDGVISARKISQYCRENKAYVWLCGGIGVSHHLLSAFRSNGSDLFDDFVVQTISLLYDKQLITIKNISHDGVKIRAYASSESMHRKSSLVSKAIEVRKYIKKLEQQLLTGELEREEKEKKKRELMEANKRKKKLIQAAQELQKHKDALNENRTKNRNKHLSNKAVAELRCSSTDPECRKMKMPDHSYKPAYNIQIATDVDTELVLKTSISQNSHDGG